MTSSLDADSSDVWNAKTKYYPVGSSCLVFVLLFANRFVNVDKFEAKILVLDLEGSFQKPGLQKHLLPKAEINHPPSQLKM